MNMYKLPNFQTKKHLENVHKSSAKAILRRLKY